MLFIVKYSWTNIMNAFRESSKRNIKANYAHYAHYKLTLLISFNLNSFMYSVKSMLSQKLDFSIILYLS